MTKYSARTQLGNARVHLLKKIPMDNQCPTPNYADFEHQTIGYIGNKERLESTFNKKIPINNQSRTPTTPTLITIYLVRR